MATAKKRKKSPTPMVAERTMDVTDEYDVFQRMPGNRPLEEPHVQTLMKSMAKHDLCTPILVNQNFEVIDGQHRLEARKRLGLPVYYYWTDGLALEDVQVLNSTARSWTNDDYCRSFIERGNEHYITYSQFRKEFNLPHSAACHLLIGNKVENLRQLFTTGQFEVKDLAKARRVAGYLQQIARHFTHWKDAGFIRAFQTALTRKGFDPHQFLHKVKVAPTLLTPCVSIDGYLQLIEEVYNYRSKTKIPIRFGLPEESENK